jgi:hypothetical protein
MIRTAEMLNAIADWLDSEDNEALIASEHDDKCLQITAQGLVSAAKALRKTASEVDAVEVAPEDVFTFADLEEMATIASEFDSSEDENIRKKAAMIDDVIMIIAADPRKFVEQKIVAAGKIQEYRNELRKARERMKKSEEERKGELARINRLDEVEKILDKSDVYKIDEESKLGRQMPLRSRHCPDHAGVMLMRLTDDEFQCPMDKKIYNFRDGYTKENGTHVPGRSVGEQSQLRGQYRNQYTVYDTRFERMNQMANKD